jgi:hypothetical protein
MSEPEEKESNIKRLSPEDRQQKQEPQDTMVVMPVPMEVYQEMYELIDEYIPRKKTKLIFRLLDTMQPMKIGVNQQ